MLRRFLRRARIPARDRTESELRYGLRLIIIAWGFGTVFFNTTFGAPFAAFVRRLGAGDLFFSLVSAAPMFGSLAQVLSSYLVERTGRRRAIFVSSAVVQRLVWIPIAFLPWLLPRGPGLLWVLAVLVFAGSVFGNLSGPAWMSWMADFVPLKIRGKYFGLRMRIGTIIGMLSALTAGLVLDLWRSAGSYLPYTVLFATAAVCGAVDVLLFTRVPEPPAQEHAEPPRLSDLVRVPFRNQPFRRFLTYSVFSTFGFNVAGPSLWLFALETLKMGKLWANLTLMVSHMLAVAVFSSVWGSLLDRYGSRPVLRVGALALAFFPVPWILAEPSSWRWLVINGFVAGAFWSGLELANFNLLLGLFPRENKSIYLATYSVIVGTVAGVAPIVGGAIAEPLRGLHVQIGPWTIVNYKVVFMVAFVWRLITALAILPRVEQVGAKATRVMVRDVAESWVSRLRQRRAKGGR
ncbi:MAG: MFS transporter [Armatimonadota bacterium]